MSFPSTDDTPPIPEFPDDITTMFNAQAELFTHTQWDVDSEIYYDDAALSGNQPLWNADTSAQGQRLHYGNHPPWNADTSGQGQGLPLGNQHADTFPHLQLDTSNLEGLFSDAALFRNQPLWNADTSGQGQRDVDSEIYYDDAALSGNQPLWNADTSGQGQRDVDSELYYDDAALSGNQPLWNADTIAQGQGLPSGNQHADISSHGIRPSPTPRRPSWYASRASFGSYSTTRTSNSSHMSSTTRPSPYGRTNRKHLGQSNIIRSHRGVERATGNPPFDISAFNQMFPKYSTILPSIYSTATSLAFAFDNSHDWPEHSTDQKPSSLLGYVRLAIEWIVRCHLEDPQDVDISVEVPQVEAYMTHVIQWCVESILSFCDTCRREGRLWAKDGYGFSATKGIEHNVKQHKNIVTHARYIHFFSGGKKTRPMAFANPVILKIYRERFYMAEDSLAKQMHAVLLRYCKLKSICSIDLSWEKGNLRSLVLCIVSGRHGAHEWYSGKHHPTGWNSADAERFPRYMELIEKNHLALAERIYGSVVSQWFRSIDFRPLSAPHDASEESEGGYVSPETDDNMGL